MLLSCLHKILVVYPKSFQNMAGVQWCCNRRNKIRHLIFLTFFPAHSSTSLVLASFAYLLISRAYVNDGDNFVLLGHCKHFMKTLYLSKGSCRRTYRSVSRIFCCCDIQAYLRNNSDVDKRTIHVDKPASMKHSRIRY